MSIWGPLSSLNPTHKGHGTGTHPVTTHGTDLVHLASNRGPDKKHSVVEVRDSFNTGYQTAAS